MVEGGAQEARPASMSKESKEASKETRPRTHSKSAEAPPSTGATTTHEGPTVVVGADGKKYVRANCGFCGNVYVKDAAFCRKCGGKRDVIGQTWTTNNTPDSNDLCDLELAHAVGVYPVPIRDACIAVGDDALIFVVGRHIAMWCHISRRIKFVRRQLDNFVVTALAKSPSGKVLAVAERPGSATDPVKELGSIQISIVALPKSASAAHEQDSHLNSKTVRVLFPVNKRSKIVDLSFTSDGRHLVSISDVPEATVTYWKWESEKAICTYNVEAPISRLNVNPKNGCQMVLSGDSYCRLWEYNPNDHTLRENASVFSLKEEKMTDIVDNCWAVVKDEAYLLVATQEGHVHVFLDGELIEDIDIHLVIADDESVGAKAAEREQARLMARMMGGEGPTGKREEPEPVTLLSLAPWGQGFVVGGDQGYLGVFRIQAPRTIERFGTFRMPGENSSLWCMSSGTEDTYLNILSYTEQEPETDPTKSGFSQQVGGGGGGGSVTGGGSRLSRRQTSLLGSATNFKPAKTDNASVSLEEPNEKEKIWSFTTFPVSQADLATTGQLDLFVPWVPTGMHSGPINDITTSRSRRIVATCGQDKQLKIWSYPSEEGVSQPNAFGSELTIEVSPYDKPLKLAIHPMGFQVAVILPDVLRIYHLTPQQASRTLLDLPLKHPGDVCYSNSGELLACTSNNDVILIDPIKAVLIRVFSGSGGHLSFVNQVSFSDDDKQLLSCSAAPSGAIYGWDLESEAKDRIFEHFAKGTDYSCFRHDFRRNLCCAIARTQGSLRMIGHNNNNMEEIVPETPANAFTSLELAAPLGVVFAGTQSGHIRIFQWPLKAGGPEANPFVQVEVHAHAITAMSICSNARFLYSTCQGGAVVSSRIKAFHVVEGGREELSQAAVDLRFMKFRRREDTDKKRKMKREEERKAHDLQQKLQEAVASSCSTNTATLDDLMMIPRTYFQELLTEIQHLEERCLTLKHESDSALEQKEAELSEKMEQLHIERRSERENHEQKYDQLFDQHKEALRRHEDELRRANSDFSKRSRAAEDEHHGKMSKEFEKENLLLGELQSLKEQHQEKLLKIDEKHSQQLEEMRVAHENAIHEWRTEYDKVCHILKSDGLKFEEAIRQQESEYEDQIKEILEVKRKILQVESEKSTTAFKDAVSMKQTISMLQSSIVEYKAKFDESERQKGELQKQLQASKSMFTAVQEQLKEEKRALKVKNESLAKIREQMKHLESFRFVLFHKVKQLEEERDPLAEQVSALHQNVEDMYGEFVREFRSKQTLDQDLTDKKALVSSLQEENTKLNRQLIQLKKDARQMLNDVEQVVHADTAAEFERIPKRLMKVVEQYQKLSNWKPPEEQFKNDDPADPTKEQCLMNEMVVQRDLLFRKNQISLSAATQVKRECSADLRRLTSENAALIAEMNTLRTENRSLLRTCKEHEAAIIAFRAKEKERQVVGASSESAQSGDESPNWQKRGHSGGSGRGEGGEGGSGGEGGGLTSSSSAGVLLPAKGGDEMTGGGSGVMRGVKSSGSGMVRGSHSTGSLGGTAASETPYLRRKVVDQQEMQKRMKQRTMMSQLPPVPQAYPDPSYFNRGSGGGVGAKSGTSGRRFVQPSESSRTLRQKAEPQGGVAISGAGVEAGNRE